MRVLGVSHGVSAASAMRRRGTPMQRRAAVPLLRTLLPRVCYRPNLVALGLARDPKHFGDAGDPPSLDGDMADP